jgi:pectinesterase
MNGKLYPSANFHGSRVLANGPIRVSFELTYVPWVVGGARVSEVKRITLDAGRNFDHFESRYTINGTAADLEDAIGIRKGIDAQISKSTQAGILRSWETLPDHHGKLGCAIIVAPATLVDFSEDSKNSLVIVKLGTDKVVSYDAGFGWSESGFPGEADWDRYAADYQKRVAAPLEVTISTH